MSHVDSPVLFPFVESGVLSQSSPLSHEISAKFWIVAGASLLIVNVIFTGVLHPAGILAIVLTAVLPD
jgi:hypothetical protein